MKKNYKKAFTLSETLIVLTIIAILAAIVSSALISRMPKRSVLMFKKTYFGLSQALENVSNNSFFYTDDKNNPRLSTANTNLAMADDVRKILNLPSGTDLDADNWLCYTMANSIKHKSINCSACTDDLYDTKLNFVTEDGVGVYGLCGAFHGLDKKIIYLLMDQPKRSNLTFNKIKDEAMKHPKSLNTFAFYVTLTPEGTLAPGLPPSGDTPRLEEQILMDATVNH